MQGKVYFSYAKAISIFYKYMKEQTSLRSAYITRNVFMQYRGSN